MPWLRSTGENVWAMLLKMTAGCKVPWHWQSVGEQVMVVSGIGKAEMKAGTSQRL
jgi:phage baseplate assembly protein gpV